MRAAKRTDNDFDIAALQRAVLGAVERLEDARDEFAQVGALLVRGHNHRGEDRVTGGALGRGRARGHGSAVGNVWFHGREACVRHPGCPAAAAAHALPA